jgi:hypothetical protein
MPDEQCPLEHYLSFPEAHTPLAREGGKSLAFFSFPCLHCGQPLTAYRGVTRDLGSSLECRFGGKCVDCHSVVWSVFRLYDSHIILRDADGWPLFHYSSIPVCVRSHSEYGPGGVVIFAWQTRFNTFLRGLCGVFARIALFFKHD